MCRIDEQNFPIDPRQMTPQEWGSYKRCVTECAQQARQQALRAAAIALLRVLAGRGLLRREPDRADSGQGVGRLRIAA